MPDGIADWIASHDDPDHPLVPAATVLLVRDGPAGLETLLVRRADDLSFADGMWVFPGGRVDAGDRPPDGDLVRAAVNAAVREALEEAGLAVDPRTLRYHSHWIPPAQTPKRFSTWFFLAPAPEGQVSVDQGEIMEHAWWRPGDALDRAADGLLRMMVPTWMSLHELADHATVDDAVASADERGPRRYATRIVGTPDGPAAAWEDDAAHRTGRHDTPGPRHRLVMAEHGWRLERTPG